MPVLVGAGLLCLLLAVVQLPRQGLGAPAVLLFDLSVRVQAAGRVAEPTESVGELAAGMRKKLIYNTCYMFFWLVFCNGNKDL